MGSVKAVTKSLGAARDLDVQIEVVNNFIQNSELKYVTGARRLRNRLLQKRLKLQTKVQHTMAQAMADGQLLDMRDKFSPLPVALPDNGDLISESDQIASPENPIQTSPELYYRAVNSIFKRLDNFLAYEIAMYDPANILELHAMRIQAKWLRYAIEAFSVLYPDELKKPLDAARTTQEYLGNIHDCDVWASILPGFIKREYKLTKKYYGTDAPFNFLRPGLEAFMANRAETRNTLYQDFLAQWAAWQKDGVWDKLRLSLTEPLANPPGQQALPETKG
jgi:CHAD domain-containing protein